jgi:hypothetical protein
MSRSIARVALVIAALVTGCKTTPEDSFRARAQQLRQRTTPAENAASELAAITHSGTVTRTEWQLNCLLSEPAFKQFLSQRLEPEFSKLSPTHEQPVYGRFAGGDWERIEITQVRKNGNITQYAIRFSGCRASDRVSRATGRLFAAGEAAEGKGKA